MRFQMIEDTQATRAKAGDPIHQIQTWCSTAVPRPESVNITTQIGVRLEEVAEMLEPISDMSMNQQTSDQLNLVLEMLRHMSKQFKSPGRGFLIDTRYVDRKDLLDALCDQIVTAVGIAHMFGMDIEGALREVADSNDLKFDQNGQPIFNTHRKIIKGPSYRAPDLSPYI